jgi:hypothetical protein
MTTVVRGIEGTSLRCYGRAGVGALVRPLGFLTARQSRAEPTPDLKSKSIPHNEADSRPSAGLGAAIDYSADKLPVARLSALADTVWP